MLFNKQLVDGLKSFYSCKKVLIQSILQDEIDKDGKSALEDITREYYVDVELYKLEKEEEILREIEEEQAGHKKEKLDCFMNC